MNVIDCSRNWKERIVETSPDQVPTAEKRKLTGEYARIFVTQFGSRFRQMIPWLRSELSGVTDLHCGYMRVAEWTPHACEPRATSGALDKYLYGLYNAI